MRGVRALRAVLACFLIVAATVGAVGGVDAAERPARASTVDAGVVQVGTTVAQQNNSTVQHADPDSVEGPDGIQLQSYLRQRLTAQLAGSVVNLSEGQYNQARSLLGDQFREDYQKYVDVAGSPDENEDAEAFETAQQRQQRYLNRTQEYRETKAAYVEAVESGNETRARELARELSRTAARLNETQANLSVSYAALENQTETNLTSERESLRENTQNITTDAANITRSTFTPTRLSLSANATPVSFLDPLRLSGRIVTENGTAVSNQTVVLRVEGRQFDVRTDADGAFSLLYRPAQLHLDTETLTVDYVPTNGSVYLGSNASVSVEPRQVDATTTVDTVETAQFGQNVTVHGRIAVDDIPAAGVPVRLTLGETTVATANTNDSGGYVATFSLPSGVPSGTRFLTASLAQSNRTIAGPPAETTLRIVPTATTLDVNASHIEAGTARIGGTLQTVAGTPIRNRSVELAIGGSVVTTVETDSDGRFETTVQTPASLRNASAVTVRAAFDGAGSNLDPSRASVTLTTEAADSTGLLQLAQRTSGVALVGGAGLVAVVSAVGLFLLLRRPDSEPGDETAPAESRPGTTDALDGEQPNDAQRVEAAAAHLEDDPSLAVEFAFTAVREELGRHADVDGSATAREFAHAYRDAHPDGETVARLEQLVDVYERAAFGPTAVSRDDAQSAVEAARTLLS